MRLLQLSNTYDGFSEGQRACEEDYDELLNEDCKVLKPDGSLLLVLLKKSVTKEHTALAWSVLKEEHMYTDNRGTATGEGISVINKKTRSNVLADSGIIGFFERTPRYPYCRACAWNLNNPEKWAMIVPLVREVDGLFKTHAPERYAAQAKIAGLSHSDFLIPGTYFSTLTVNKNFRTAYHKDAGNLPEGISAMTVMRQGKWTGANLVFPKFRVAVKLDSFDTIIFDPHEVHGNTPLVKLSEDAVRCSIVYYFRDKIQHCKSNVEELAIVKNRQPGHLFETKLRKK